MQKKGFTLIELLIVVAIIAILAAIAVPNFLEAQTRAKISRTKNDMRTVTVALESYHVDGNMYPYPKIGITQGFDASGLPWIYELSTPIAYITSTNIRDPFASKNYWYHYGGEPYGGFRGSIDIPICYVNFKGFWAYNQNITDKSNDGYVIKGNGPDRWPQWPEWSFMKQIGQTTEWIGVFRNSGGPGANAWDQLYDPTNGTVSAGDLVRFGGALPSNPGMN